MTVIDPLGRRPSQQTKEQHGTDINKQRRLQTPSYQDLGIYN
jgi:hypothetical protein